MFWPYAFDDIFTFAFWPSDYAGYDGPFWARAYSDTVDGVFKADGNADVETPAAEVHAEHGGRWHGAIGRSRAGVRGLTGQSREFARICGRRAPDLTDWPIERITRTVQSRGVRQQLAELAAAATAGAAMLHAACRIELPTSPIDRIEGEQLRLDAASRALAVVRPQVGAFWARLSDDQKARFDSRQDGPAAAAQGSDPSSALDRTGWASAAVCADNRSPAGQQALAWIDDVVQPTGTQRGLLADLRDANAGATQLLQSSCPTVMPRTPPERLDVLARRLAVMLDAVGLERRALQRFYASLTKAQQARLNGTGCDGTCP